EEGVGIRSPFKIVNPIAERFGEHAGAMCRTVVDGQAKEVGFVAGLFLQAIGDVFPVRGILGAAIIRGVRSSDVLGWRGPGHWNYPEVAVGRDGGLWVVVGFKDKLAAIRGKVVLQRASKLERWSVEIAGREVADGAGGDAGKKEVSALSVLPFGPVAVEQRGRCVRMKRALAPAALDFLVAGIVGATFRIDVAGKGDPFPVGGPERTGNTGGDFRQGPRLAAGSGNEEKVGIAVAGADEDDPFSVGREDRGGFTLFAVSELTRVLAVGVHQPEVTHAFCTGQVIVAQDKKERLAVRRNGQIFDAAEAIEILDREGALGGAARDGKEQNAQGEQKQLAAHGTPPGEGILG